MEGVITTHLPYRPWRPACVAERARDRPHRRLQEQEAKRIPEIAFGGAFLGGEGERGTVAVLVTTDRLTNMLLAHAVPKKVLGTCAWGPATLERCPEDGIPGGGSQVRRGTWGVGRRLEWGSLVGRVLAHRGSHCGDQRGIEEIGLSEQCGRSSRAEGLSCAKG